MSGIDIDVVDVTSKLIGGQTSVPISATSTGDTYYLAGFVTSIPTFKPDFSTSEKSAVDVNGGALLPGDIVEYTVVSTNTGNDTSVNTVLTDPLPMGVTYVPGTTSITAGANIGAKTDVAGDDQCEYVAGTRTVLCRLGTGASSATGGQMVVGASSTVKFQVTVDAGASGTILNQATITAGRPFGRTGSKERRRMVMV
jgi:clumping factor A